MNNDKLKKGENTGVIVEIKPTDFVAGAETGIVYEERNPTGDWEKYKPTDEWQRKMLNGIGGYDTMSCVTFSALNSVETSIYYLLMSGEFTIGQIQTLNELGYLDENGRPNFNDWFTAVMSKTTTNGNSMQNVWDSIRRDGLLPQKEGYTVNDFTNIQQWLTAQPTQAQKDKALLIKDIIDVAYEWVSKNDFPYHLKQAPIHILTPTGANWNTQPPTIVPDPGVKTVNHATLLIGQVANQYNKDLDHYNPFIKYLSYDYFIPYAIKTVVTVKKPVAPQSTFKYVFNTNLAFGMGATTEVKMLQTALQSLGCMKQGVFGPYGPQTRVAVKLFQTTHNILTDDGSNFGPRSRAAMNAELAK